jgi:hypothetical protein
MNDSDEKRQYPRLVLGVEDGFFGNFILTDKNSLMASIVNISAGGVNFSAPAKVKEQISEGDVLLLKNIVGATQLSFLEGIQAEIRWIKAIGDPGNISVGCTLKSLSGPVLDQMIRFVDAERMVRGQYD